MTITNLKEFEEKINILFQTEQPNIQKEFIKLFNLKKNQPFIQEFISDQDKVFDLFDYISSKYSQLTSKKHYGNLEIKTVKKFIELLEFEKQNMATHFLSDILLDSLCNTVTSAGIKASFENYQENTDILCYLLFHSKNSLIKNKIHKSFASIYSSYGTFYLNIPKHNKLFNLMIHNIKIKGKLNSYSYLLRSFINHVNISSIPRLLKSKKIATILDVNTVKNNIYYKQVQNEILYNFVETYMSYNYPHTQKEELLSFLLAKEVQFYDIKDFFPKDKFLNTKKKYYRIIETDVPYFEQTEKKIHYLLELFIKHQGKFDFCNDLLLKELFRCGLSSFFIDFFEEHYKNFDNIKFKKMLNTFQSISFRKKLNHRSPLFGMTKDYQEQQQHMINYLNKVNLEYKLKDKPIQFKKNKI